MDFAELTASRRTVHSYKTDKVADSLVEKALQLSLWAPNHKQTFPWAYFWVGAEVRTKLAELALALKEAKEPQSEMKKKAIRESVVNPSHLILLATRRGDPTRAHEDFATLACSVQIASLFLWEAGVGTKWTTSGWTNQAKVYEILGISPDEFVLEGGLMVGAPLAKPPLPKRPPLEKFLRRTE